MFDVAGNRRRISFYFLYVRRTPSTNGDPKQIYLRILSEQQLGSRLVSGHQNLLTLSVEMEGNHSLTEGARARPILPYIYTLSFLYFILHLSLFSFQKPICYASAISFLVYFPPFVAINIRFSSLAEQREEK